MYIHKWWKKDRNRCCQGPDFRICTHLRGLLQANPIPFQRPKLLLMAEVYYVGSCSASSDLVSFRRNTAHMLQDPEHSKWSKQAIHFKQPLLNQMFMPTSMQKILKTKNKAMKKLLSLISRPSFASMQALKHGVERHAFSVELSPPKHMRSKSVTQQKSKPIQLDAFVKSAV